MGVTSILLFIALMEVVQSRYYSDQLFDRRIHVRDYPQAIQARDSYDYNPFQIKQRDAIRDRRSRYLEERKRRMNFRPYDTILSDYATDYSDRRSGYGRFEIQKSPSMDFRPYDIVPAFRQQRFQDMYQDNLNFVTTFNKYAAYIGFDLAKRVLQQGSDDEYKLNLLQKKYEGKSLMEMIGNMLNSSPELWQVSNKVMIFADFIDLDEAFTGIAYYVLKKYMDDGTVTLDKNELKTLTKQDDYLNEKLEYFEYYPVTHIKPLTVSLAGVDSVPSNGDLEAAIKRLATRECINSVMDARDQFKLAKVAAGIIFEIYYQGEELKDGVPDYLTLTSNDALKNAIDKVSGIDMSAIPEDIVNMAFLQHLLGKDNMVVDAMKLGANLYRKMRFE